MSEYDYEIKETISNGNYKKTNNPLEIAIFCPNLSCDNREDKEPKLFYNIAKKKYHCKKCLIKGELKSFKLDLDYNPSKHKSLIFDGRLPKGVCKLTPKICSEEKIKKEALNYLYKERGLEEKDIEDYNLYYGLFGRYSKRIVFPFIENNKLVYFVARDFTNKAEKKVLNPAGNKEIFNLERAAQFEEVVIVEGVMDAIKTGYDSIAILGHDISEHQINKIKLYEIKDVNIMFDPEVEDEELYKTAKKLKKHFRTVKIIRIPKGLEDPGKLNLRKRGIVKSWKNIFKEENYTTINRYKNVKIKF